MPDGITLAAIPDWLKPLIGVFVGWLLGTATEAWKQRRKNRRYYDAIYAELDDVHSALATRLLILKEILTAYLNRTPITGMPSDIHNPIYEKHFAEIALQFTQHERFALTHIYSLLESMRRAFAIIRENSDLNSPDNSDNMERLRRVVQTSEGAYLSGRQLDLLIHFALREKEQHDTRAPHIQNAINDLDKKLEAELLSMRDTAKGTRTGSPTTPP